MSPPTKETSEKGPPAHGTPGDREIHRLFDGDLSAAERDALRATRDVAELRERLEGLGEVRAIVRAVADGAEAEGPLDSEAMWAQVAARIEGASSAAQEAPARAPARADAARPALRVLEGGAAARLPQGAGASEAANDALERERRVRSRRAIMAIVGGLAAAAAAVIAYLGPGEAPVEDETVAIGTQDGHDELGPILDPAADEELRRTEVIAVDFGANVGTVFSVEGAEGSRYAVVWLTDEAEKAPEAADPRDEGAGPALDQAPGDGTVNL